MNDLIADLNKKAALGRRNRRSNTIKQCNKGYYDKSTAIQRRFEREIPLTQAAMIRFMHKMIHKSIKVVWFGAGKSDVVKMIKDCKMFAEKIPAEIAQADTELGAYFSGAGKFLVYINSIYHFND